VNTGASRILFEEGTMLHVEASKIPIMLFLFVAYKKVKGCYLTQCGVCMIKSYLVREHSNMSIPVSMIYIRRADRKCHEV